MGLAFLWGNYEPRAYCWEIVECVRKIALSGFVGMLFSDEASGKQHQLIAASLCCLIYVFFNDMFSPHLDKPTNRLANSAAWASFIVLYCGIIGQSDTQVLQISLAIVAGSSFWVFSTFVWCVWTQR